MAVGRPNEKHVEKIRFSILREGGHKMDTKPIPLWEGKSHQFTNQFMGNMYTDESMHTTSLKLERIKIRMKLLRDQEHRVQTERISMRTKQRLADEILEEFPKTKLPMERLKLCSVVDLLRLRETKRLNRRRDEA
jgi:hypothetical protein